MVAAAAYRLGAALRDQRYGVTHNYLGKRGVTYSQIMAPAMAPPWARDREALWNTVEAGELRNAQSHLDGVIARAFSKKGI